MNIPFNKIAGKQQAQHAKKYAALEYKGFKLN